MKQEVLKDKAGSVSMTPYLNNRPAIATSATVVITDTGGTSISTGNGSIDSTTGEIRYSFASSVPNKLGENFQAQWTYIIDAVTYYQTTLFDVVLNRLSISVVDDDLLVEQSDIMERNESFSGTVDSATSTTLVDANMKSFINDFWNGGKVTAVNPTTGVEQTRTITDFVQSTGTITVDTAWETNPTSSYTFQVRRGFAHKIAAAFEETLLDVKSRGYRPALVLESSELKPAHTKKALAMVCRDFIKEAGDKWDVLAATYDKQYADMFAKITFSYDRNQSGYIGGAGEENQDVGSVRLKR